jgi:FkbH-like protein
MRRGDGTASTEPVRQAEQLRRAGDVMVAIDRCLAAARADETPPAEIALELARGYLALGDGYEALRWAVAVTDATDHFALWHAAARIADEATDDTVQWPWRTTLRVAVLGSYTTAQLVPLLRLAAARQRMRVDVYEAADGQYRQAILDPSSALYRYRPDVVLIAPHWQDLDLPYLSDGPEDAVVDECSRWSSLWSVLAERSPGTRVVQHGFVVPPADPLGHLGAQVAGSPTVQVQRLNHQLGAAAGNSVRLVDCERVAAWYGKARWFDERYWYAARQGVALDALPLLARHTTAVIASSLGLGRKCIVVDLDNTLWGGMIGEDGLDGIRLGERVGGGEAFVDFQRYLRRLKDRGLILAACSKNDDAVARTPFERHPDMQLRIEDFSAFVATWEPKPVAVRRVAQELSIALDAMVFVDDNLVERQTVRRMIPEVDVVALPPDPAYYTRTLAEYLMLEPPSLTTEDRARSERYRLRAAAAEVRRESSTLDEFWRDLEMRAEVAPFDALHLPRVEQLIARSNQFNLTGRRWTLSELTELAEDPACESRYLRLRDRFGDHGLVAAVVAVERAATLDIELFVMSCRVLGRTVERTLLEALSLAALRRGCAVLRGLYIPTPRNGIVADLYPRLGFHPSDADEAGARWEYDVRSLGPMVNRHIVTEDGERVA